MGQALSARVFRLVPLLAAICAVITVLGMAQVRMGATARLSMTPLTDLVTRLHPDRVEGDYFLAGNLNCCAQIRTFAASVPRALRAMHRSVC